MDALEGMAGARRVRVGAELARTLVMVRPPLRHAEAPRLFEELLGRREDVILLDRIEILFLPSLALSVVDVLREASRVRTIVVAWPLPSSAACKTLAHEHVLLYATPGHPEHVRAPVHDVPVWCLG